MKKYLMLLIVAVLALSACSSNKKPDTTKIEDTKSVQNGEQSSSSIPTEAELAATKLAEQTSMANKIDKQGIYFDFDKSVVKKQFHELLKKQAEFMKNNKSSSLTLEGNCDERGSAEYNLALGQRRAEAVSHELQLLGIERNRIGVVSNGKKKPKLTCHEEKCWQENRRVDFIHQLN